MSKEIAEVLDNNNDKIIVFRGLLSLKGNQVVAMYGTAFDMQNKKAQAVNTANLSLNAVDHIDKALNDIILQQTKPVARNQDVCCIKTDKAQE